MHDNDTPKITVGGEQDELANIEARVRKSAHEIGKLTDNPTLHKEATEIVLEAIRRERADFEKRQERGREPDFDIDR